jgi:hypothetical protein
MSEPSRTLIRARTAFLLYGVLLAAAYLTLKGKFLSLAVIIVIALAAKTYLDHLRQRL